MASFILPQAVHREVLSFAGSAVLHAMGAGIPWETPLHHPTCQCALTQPSVQQGCSWPPPRPCCTPSFLTSMSFKSIYTYTVKHMWSGMALLCQIFSFCLQTQQIEIAPRLLASFHTCTGIYCTGPSLHRQKSNKQTAPHGEHWGRSSSPQHHRGGHSVQLSCVIKESSKTLAKSALENSDLPGNTSWHHCQLPPGSASTVTALWWFNNAHCPILSLNFNCWNSSLKNIFQYWECK